MKSKPYIHTLSSPDLETFSGVFAIRLAACVTQRCRIEEVPKLLAQQLERQADLLHALHLVRERPVFAVRTISKPNPLAFAAGSVELAFLGKVDDASRERVSDVASRLCIECASLLSGFMPDHTWSVVSDRQLFDKLWNPFALKSAHVAEIRRREDSLQLS